MVEFDDSWVTVTEHSGKKVRRKSYSSQRVQALIRNYGKAEERLVFGEDYSIQKSLVVRTADSSGNGSAQSMAYRNMLLSADHMREAGVYGMMASGALVFGSGAAIILMSQGSGEGALTVFSASWAFGLGFGIASGFKLRKAGVLLDQHVHNQLPH